MPGIYIHIPFCKKKCHYCNFHFTTSMRYKADVVKAIIKEIELQKGYLGTKEIETVYFGGGSPSVLSIEELSTILQELNSQFHIITNAEITLEANPDDITEEKLRGWKNAGINRLSIGIQSFFEEDLQWMNRAHNAEQAVNTLKLAQTFFSNITIDLIYGTPGLSNKKWEENVKMAISLKVPHLSCYALTVEPKTPLDKLISTKVYENVVPEKQSEQFLLLMKWMKEAGYEHYEISNFCLPGWRSKHNSSYWQGVYYLGIGPSAHSYNGTERQWNVANNNLYTESLSKSILPFEKELLTPTQQLNEYIMISLRTAEGINFNTLNERFNIPREELLRKAACFISTGKMTADEMAIVLTDEGKLLTDGIAADLFY
ncbi:MAG TPA: radical SAM family heme chaperone HemW [Chitinophagaceae bacterium]|nr:radical SAM family heme chaperone HemW [Chitinophagaceae bacterium]